ncbi:hypothetical protein ASU31_25140 [Pedobacter ginsenosidimutans]|uniref:Uncharacterized protein n=1 Tax=Pedobacter ginsenosidimutans TaxID=687842 RepID=A0A0T5VI78_9SPHI|nr:hypothetical protein ASU31_25140 [Pedobacter ginsenosidimutans]
MRQQCLGYELGVAISDTLDAPRPLPLMKNLSDYNVHFCASEDFFQSEVSFSLQNEKKPT